MAPSLTTRGRAERLGKGRVRRAVEAGEAFYVRTTNDSGPDSLRDAIANATTPGARILFDLPSSSQILLNTVLDVPSDRTLFLDASRLVDA